ncbi:MAG: D-alanyl-D-alanine carboxypeptidase, partial [Acetobacteraceae bacterium]|nr:D-alanyl-D-alanine carboxypeptidase [Acetobacteraceae bacterium]
MPVAKSRRGFVARFLVGVSLLMSVGAARPALAQVGSDRYASMVVDAASGTIISAANPDEYRYPASLTKMMTIYLLFEALRDNRIALSDLVPVSAWAASMPPTKLGLIPGSAITVEQALLGLVTKSANDAAAALGELMGGDEERFAQMMTLRARALGMSRTTFRNASGLPDWDQMTTARDMVILARHLIQDFPAYYHYFSTPSFQFHGRTILTHQRLLQTYPGADGLKTGYTEASGYNVVTSAERGDVRLIGVVLGAASGGERDLHMAALLDQGFQRMGVPIEVASREPPSYRMPSLIGVAAAAPYARGLPMQIPDVRVQRVRGRRLPAEMRAVPVRGQVEGRSARSRSGGPGQIVAEVVVPRAAAATRPAALVPR